MRDCDPEVRQFQTISSENLSQVPANKNKLRGYYLDHHNSHRNIRKAMNYMNEQKKRLNGVSFISELKIGFSTRYPVAINNRSN